MVTLFFLTSGTGASSLRKARTYANLWTCVVRVALLCTFICSCAPQGENRAPAVTLESSTETLSVLLVARQGDNYGEICATLTVSLDGEVDDIGEECGSVSSPTPIVGGYSVAELHLDGFIYSWGALRMDVEQIKAPENVVIDQDRLLLEGYEDCCVLYLATLRSGDPAHGVATLRLLDVEGQEQETVALQLPGPPRAR